MSENLQSLHLPDGINYECTGCGKCCGGWAVPMTPVDYERIAATNWGEKLDKFAGKSLFRALKPYERVGTPYDHAIKEGADGRCPFLVDNLCYIHSQNGAESKPSICQLFPYCFNETPSGVYATVSFVSMGVVHNSGKALTEQREFLSAKLAEFQRLYPDHHPNWGKLELTGGQSLSWEEYLKIEKQLLEYLQARSAAFEQRLLKGSAYLHSLGTGKNGGDNAASNESAATTMVTKLRPLDKHLLVALHKIYFPVRILGRGEGDFNPARFAYQILFQWAFPGLHISLPGHSYSFEELAKVPWPGQDKDIEDLLYRYFYSRIFAKLYFSAGFGQLSLIAGYHHLILLYALIKLQSRALTLARGANVVSYVDVVAAVRQLEKRLGETAVGAYAAAIFELLMFSHLRALRILAAV